MSAAVTDLRLYMMAAFPHCFTRSLKIDLYDFGLIKLIVEVSSVTVADLELIEGISYKELWFGLRSNVYIMVLILWREEFLIMGRLFVLGIVTAFLERSCISTILSMGSLDFSTECEFIL